MRRARVIAGLILLASGTASASPSLLSYAGSWKITTIVGWAETSQSGDAANALVGTTADLSARDFRLRSDTCPARPVTIRTAKVATVLDEESHASRHDVDVDGRLLGAKAPYIEGACASALALTDGSLIVFAPTGAMYRAFRTH